MAKAESSAPSSFIDPQPPQQLARASSEGDLDKSSQKLRELEWQGYIGRRRQEHADRPAPDDLTGIALSGGGIRSATFSLGVLQALAHHDLLRRFDYLSTVSGGGYIGTSLTWLTSKLAADKEAADETERAEAAPRVPAGGFGLGPSRSEAAGGWSRDAAAPFPYGSDDPRDAREPDGSRAEGVMLRYLRQHGSYLTPGKGITLTSVIVVLLRGIILNLLVWIPLVAAVMWGLISISALRLPAGAPTGGVVAGLAALVERLSPQLGPDHPDQLAAFGLMLAGALLLFAGCVAAFAAYSLVTWISHKSGRWLSGGTKYIWRRGFERWMRLPLWCIGVLLLATSVPFAVNNLYGWWLGSSFSVIGLLSGLVAFLRTTQQTKSPSDSSGVIPGTWIASFGAGFLLYGVLLLAYDFARWTTIGGIPSWVLWASVALAAATGWLVDLNLITVHRFYRDRLMEAFLPDIRRALSSETAPARQADSAPLSAMCDPEQPVGPYHILNANLVLINSDERTYRMRGGDNFMLSPLYCGSNATGWQPTEAFMGDELTVPTAMAISGAAANPWTGSGGVGLTRNPLVSTLMALMNLRLGFWLPNPNPKTRARWWRRSCEKSFRPNHFEPGLKEVLGASLKEVSPICLLSDGGHFENLALYELIRRRCRLIVLCDGTADPDYAFADLQNAMARVATDFGARIEFDKEEALRCFMPSIRAGYPRDVRLSHSASAVADVTYADGSTGKLIYLTTALCRGLRLRLLGYKSANSDFPDQTTADQFFDEEQFEAYRELGYVIADGVAPQIAGFFGRPQPHGVPEAAD